MLRMPWIEHASNEKVLMKIGITWKFILIIRKRLQIMEHIVRKVGLKNIILIGQTENKTNWRK